MVDFEYGTEVIAEGLSRAIMIVQVVRPDSIVCSYKVGDDLHTVELNPKSLRLATADDKPQSALLMPSRYRNGA
ncbi:hypothetical protein E5E97_16180 [Aeromonas sp. 2692-1]|uniref:hypothetical protein n=1 Tax=Aeromonas sp. 2692-1 TaxID=2560029 RepID=UPI00148B0D4B|nr:hypothetical protein [Aeromonas sp. 2692-1]QJT14293.1 hypothetical protein E5E97_16070 [Aeromonas sp. 2692-1]QJT14303.1 hypothetical protein E5E97_16125 [Aeromonas sp. 2692-1]QJT14313.1 hypothetical protein E5E97_16180 [Aeromonas sp. 2692-1]